MWDVGCGVLSKARDYEILSWTNTMLGLSRELLRSYAALIMTSGSADEKPWGRKNTDKHYMKEYCWGRKVNASDYFCGRKRFSSKNGCMLVGVSDILSTSFKYKLVKTVCLKIINTITTNNNNWTFISHFLAFKATQCTLQIQQETIIMMINLMNLLFSMVCIILCQKLCFWNRCECISKSTTIGCLNHAYVLLYYWR